MSGPPVVPKILFLVHRTPYPPNRGHRIRSYNLIQYLSRFAVVDTAFLADEPVTDGVPAGLAELCDHVIAVPVDKRRRWLRGLWSLAVGRSATEGLFSSPRLRREIAALHSARTYDWVIAYCSSMAQYLAYTGCPPQRCVVDLVDVDSRKFFDYASWARRPARALYRLEGRRLRRLEASLARRVRWITLVSEAECRVFRDFCPAENVIAVENGVDGDYFHPHAVRGEREQSRTDPDRAVPAGPSCVFTGALDYRANVDGLMWFLSEVWPKVRGRRSDAVFHIVGGGAGKPLREAAARAGAALTGDVPDVRPYLARATVVAPLRIARGIQNKVLEGMAMARPVIASPQALEGLAVSPGEDVLEAREPPEWVAALERLWGSPSEQRRLGDNARRLVEARYTWAARLRPLQSLLSLAEPKNQSSIKSERT
ncbi:MAG: TIGR03087 family PEP-CTERM/XrtA system glycosyltransferase [Thermogutta sp.]|nr:TIGR03087 family PEP-CTERM/XrtA system glycosyltransferase [Thermogutta sp.]